MFLGFGELKKEAKIKSAQRPKQKLPMEFSLLVNFQRFILLVNFQYVFLRFQQIYLPDFQHT
jgi:hypothetical protein